MKAITTFLLALLLCVLLPGAAHGQCQIQTFTNYGVSTSEAESGNPFSGSPGGSLQADLIVSVVVDGSATMQMESYGCPDSVVTQFNNNKQYITHFPSVLNQIGSLGGWSQGPSFCAECYSSYQTNLDSGLLNVGQTVTITSGAEVTCSMAGLVFSPPFNLLSGEIAYTRSVNTGIKAATFVLNGQLWNAWAILAYCNPATSPPDWNPLTYNAVAIYPPSSRFYIDGIAACVRINVTGAPWFCTPGVSIGWDQSLNLPQAACTHNP